MKKRLMLLTFDQTLTLDTLNSSTWVSNLKGDFAVSTTLIKDNKNGHEVLKLVDPTNDLWTLGLNASNWFWIRHIFLIRAMSLRDCIPSFNFRIKREIFGTTTIESWKGLWKNLQRVWTREAILYILDFLSTKFNIVKRIYESWLESKVTESSQLKECIGKVKPDYIILLTSGYEQVVWELQLFDFFEKRKILILINNWDNLSSKSVLPNRFGGYLLWNEQQIAYAKKQGLPNEKLFVVGSPKLDRYRQSGVTGQKAIGKKLRRILYVGQQNYHDEEGDLDAIMEALEVLDHKVNVSYRPHPSRKSILKEKSINSRGPSNFGISMAMEVDPGKDGESFGNHPLIINGSEIAIEKSIIVPFNCYDLVIGPPTTLILEAMGNRIPAIVMANHDGFSRTSGSLIWHNMCHLWELRQFLGKGLEIAHNVSQLKELFLNYEQQPNLDINEDFRKLFPVFNEDFAQRIKQALVSLYA